MRTWLYLYIIDGFPAIAISVRPLDALHVQRRVYHNLTGSTVIRFLTADSIKHDCTDPGSGCQILILEVKGGE